MFFQSITYMALTLQDPSTTDINATVTSLDNLLASSANALGACVPAAGDGCVTYSTSVVVFSSMVSGAGTTQPVTPCTSEWGAAVAAQLTAAGAEVQCPGTPPSAPPSSEPSPIQPPSPLPPGSPSFPPLIAGFPYSGCHALQSTPYTFGFTSITPSATGDLVCGVIETQACNLADSCCHTDIAKIAIHASESGRPLLLTFLCFSFRCLIADLPCLAATGDGCAGSVVSVTYAGVARSPSFSNFGSGKLVFKIPQMDGYNASNVGGLTVCYDL